MTRVYYLRFFIVIILFFLILEVSGIFQYVSESCKFQNNQNFSQHVDMVVVLAGGAGRIDKAYELMKKNRIKLLLISGASSEIGFNELAKEYNLREKDREVIKIDNKSTTTLENSKITAEFAIRNNIKKIVLVTSIYHMKRAYFLFDKVLGDKGIGVFAHSVYSNPTNFKYWWMDIGVFKNFLYEYLKFQYYKVVFSLK